MLLEVDDGPEPAGDEIEVGRGAGEKSGGDAPRQRARRRGRVGAVALREEGTRQRVGQRVTRSRSARCLLAQPGFRVLQAGEVANR